MKIPLSIRVHPIVKEFYVATTGSDTITPKSNSNLYRRILFILQLRPKDYNQTYINRRFKEQDSLTIFIGRFCSSPQKIDPLYRNYLDDYRQALISKELYESFKCVFHNYVLAYLRGGGKQQKLAIYDFCSAYNLSLTNISYEMLKKSWDRSEQKKIFLNFPCISGPSNST